MADTGKNASFSFGGQVYDEDDCLQSGGLNDSINEVIYQCGGMDKAAPGTRSVTFTVSMALAADDTAKIAALTPGTTSTFEAHPAGDEVGYQEVTATDALVTAFNRSWSANGIITGDVTIRLNDVTLGAATTA